MTIPTPYLIVGTGWGLLAVGVLYLLRGRTPHHVPA